MMSAHCMKIIYICAIVLSVSLLTITGLFSHNAFMPGYYLKGSVIIAKYVSVSWEQCVEFCLARSKCLSVEMEVRFHLCRVLSSDTLSIGVELKRKPGVWFGEKRHWDKVTIDSQCLVDCSLAEMCFINGSTICAITECGEPPILDTTSVILGSELYVGSMIQYKCIDNEIVTAMSECKIDGQWSLQEFTCPIGIIDIIYLSNYSNQYFVTSILRYKYTMP
ncbi:uncharacterized protein LOC132757064 [Ruditapes philippinarum]|uniref:uncharacterized protein LOC132757064 n=1 Tax=Ruditapes philippinarum TaxID=129788 RepID=UPI00295BCCC6|nr:uncharacterized protein LOC132757064 [Ruditapes philippinarum]